MKFQWNNDKNAINIAKHGIDFMQAAPVFEDTNAIIMQDTRHGYNEEHYQIIGITDPLGIVFVVFTEREGDVIRIISARKADKREKRLYQKNVTR